ncbi:hypothetical protein NUSPORA_00232 [Nucleospora cyclopteri]
MSEIIQQTHLPIQNEHNYFNCSCGNKCQKVLLTKKVGMSKETEIEVFNERKIPNISLKCAVNMFMMRLLCVLLFICAYNKINYVSNRIIFLLGTVEFFIEHINKILQAKKSVKLYNGSYGVIVLVTITLLPVMKNMTSYIETDTIYLIFFICTLIFCIESVSHKIRSAKTTEYVADRNKPIPLDEAIIIPCKNMVNGTVGYISGTFALINIISRVKEDYEILNLLSLGLMLFFYLPTFFDDVEFCGRTSFISVMFAIVAIVFIFIKEYFCLFLELTVVFPLWLLFNYIVGLYKENE